MNDSRVHRSHPGMLIVAALVLIDVVYADQAKGEFYAVTTVGPSGYEPQKPFINDQGQITILVESIASPGSFRYEFLDGGSSLDMRPTFPLGAALNNSGQLLGLIPSVIPDHFDLKLHQGNAETIVGSIEREHERAGIADFNDMGEFIGNHYTTGFLDMTVFVGTIGGATHRIQDLGGNYAFATDINNRGQAVGVSLTGASPQEIDEGAAYQEAFLYENGAMRGLGTIAGSGSFAHAINDLGQVVGESSTAEQRGHAFLYDPVLGMQDIGHPGVVSFALDINNHSQVVGVEGSQAFLYDARHGTRLLDDLIPANSGWTILQRATSINNHGQIVGTGIFHGETRAFLLTPIPEPSSLALILLGALWTTLSARGNKGDILLFLTWGTRDG